MQSIHQLPKARKDNLIVKELPEETLVYDRDRDQAHCLNDTAARIWKHCNGRNSIREIADLVGIETTTSVDERIVWLALAELEKFNLLEIAAVTPSHLGNLNRRQLVRNIGFAALALPVIISIAAPDAQAQASKLPSGACCNGASECLSNSCVQTPTCVGLPAPSTKSCA